MKERPNFLWIVLEDCSPRLGCYGDSLASTPHIDRLASEGRLYRNAFSTAPVCAPARHAMITGMYAVSTGAQHMRTSHYMASAPRPVPPYEAVPPPFVRLIPEYLRARGYYCTNNSKTDYQFQAPFSAWDENHNRAHWHGRAPGQPFLAMFHLFATHESGMWPETKPTVETDPARVTLPPYLPDTPETRLALARHYDNLSRVDSQAGALLQQLEEDGERDRTVVILCSDHGEGLPRHKRWPYDSGIHVPLVIRRPGEPASEVCTDLVSTIDLGLTILSLAGIPLPAHFQGRAFLGPAAEEPRDYVFATRDRYDEFYDCMRAVRDRRFKYIRNYQPEQSSALWNDYLNRHPAQQELWRRFCANTLQEDEEFFFRHARAPEELYDTKQDPHEQHNLSADPAFREDLQRLRRVLTDWQREIGDRYEESEDQMLARIWPGCLQPETETPYAILYRPKPPEGLCHHGQDVIEIQAPAALQLYAPTHGASVGYRWAGDPADQWRLYTGPIRLEAGDYDLEIKSIRIGYRESSVRHCRFSVR